MGNNTQLWQLMQIPKHFKDETEQTELHSCQLVNVEISLYPFFLNTKTEISSGNHAKTGTKKRKPYHKTIVAVLLPSFFELRDNKRPHPDYVAHNVCQPRNRKITCRNCLSQTLPRLHPITMLSTFESGNDEFSLRKGIKRPKLSGSSFLEAASEQFDVKGWIFQQSSHVSVSHILRIAFNKGVWPSRNWHQRCPTANGTQNLPHDNQLATSIDIVTINHANSHRVEIVLAPRTQKRPSVRPAFLKLKAELLVLLHPLSDSIQNAWKHSIEIDWLQPNH